MHTDSLFAHSFVDKEDGNRAVGARLVGGCKECACDDHTSWEFHVVLPLSGSKFQCMATNFPALAFGSISWLSIWNSLGWKMPSKMELLRSLHGFSIPNFSPVSIWRQLFLHYHLLVTSSTWLESNSGTNFESWKADINKHGRWFHSSRVKFFFSTYLIWILGSKFTLRVLETCLNIGTLPVRIILITALLSSKMRNIVPVREELTFEETKSTLDSASCP